MSDFTNVKPQTDPTKHVNFVPGMILGVDDFNQEFAYLSGRDRAVARSLAGYGTVSGLNLTFNDDLQVVVSSGVALSPTGQLIRVDAEQCATLNTWLEAHKDELDPATPLTLYVTLSYGSRNADLIPIPGDPCNGNRETMKPSRVVDDFRLEFSATPPDQTEEAALRTFISWLNGIRIEDTLATPTSLEDFEAALHDAINNYSAESGSATGDPLADVHIRTEDACAYLRAAFRLWTVEMRPAFLESFNGQHNLAAAEEVLGARPQSILLAELRIEHADLQVSRQDQVQVLQENRPYVLHTRMLQEALLCGRHVDPHSASISRARTYATAFMTDSQSLAAWLHFPGQLTIPSEAIKVEAMNAVGERSDLQFSIEQIGGVNIVLIFLAAPPANNSLIIVRFDTKLITLASDSSVTLFSALEELDYTDLDDDNQTLLTYVQVHRPALGELADVASAVPDDGQFLKWNQGEWHPAELPAIGLDDLKDVDAAGAIAGDILMRGREGWTITRLPRPEPAAGSPAYSVVAVGIVKGDGSVRPPEFNNLSAIKMSGEKGKLKINFEGYALPDESFNYIVKVTPFYDDTAKSLLKGEVCVSVDRFEADAFLLRITDGTGKAISDTATKKALSSLEFMIEVSRYEYRGEAQFDQARFDRSTFAASASKDASFDETEWDESHFD